MIDVSSLAKEQTIRITDIFIDKTEALTEALKKAARELVALRRDSIKQELAALDHPGLIERMTGANQAITDELLLETGQSASPNPYFAPWRCSSENQDKTIIVI